MARPPHATWYVRRVSLPPALQALTCRLGAPAHLCDERAFLIQDAAAGATRLPWRWPCVAPLAGPSVGVVDRKRGENIGEVIGSLVAHQSGQRETKRKGDGPATQANHYKLLVTVIIKRGGRNLTPITHGLVVITRLVG